MKIAPIINRVETCRIIDDGFVKAGHIFYHCDIYPPKDI
jgi:hypothetical protein